MARVDDFADAEFRVVEAAFNRHVQNDFAFAIFHNRHGQPHGQMRGIRAVHLFAKRELVERDDIFRIQFFADHFIFEVEIQFPVARCHSRRIFPHTDWSASGPRPSRKFLFRSSCVPLNGLMVPVMSAGPMPVHQRVQIHVGVLQLFGGNS